MPPSDLTTRPAAITPGPILRWTGGKRRLLPQLLALFPASTTRYLEPFFGGGAVYFALVAAGRAAPDTATVADLNPALVALYRHLSRDVDALLAELRGLDAARRAEIAAGGDGQTHYLTVRAQINEVLPAAAEDLDVGDAARVLYLNRTGFNGLWRVNGSGKLNVPWGKLANPMVVNEPLLRSVAAALPAPERILHVDYQQVSRTARAGELLYCDPPYIPHTLTASFTKYTPDDFTRRDQHTLAGHLVGLAEDGVDVVASNADDLGGVARRIFGGANAGPSGWHLLQVSVTRSVSAKASTRGSVCEIVAVSYGPDRCVDPAALAGLGVRHIASSGPTHGWDRLLPAA